MSEVDQQTCDLRHREADRRLDAVETTGERIYSKLNTVAGDQSALKQQVSGLDKAIADLAGKVDRAGWWVLTQALLFILGLVMLLLKVLQ
jgi:hypothetical protein